MTLLLDDSALDARRAVVGGPLVTLADSLAAELTPLLAGEIYFPADKAVLSREGGRCPRDGSWLDFDPFQPHVHRCPRCGESYRGELHDRYWIYWYQLWLAERAVHGATLARLGRGDQFAGLAERILDGYVERYSSYPNRDNVLGPTRLFFSTYLESIWLLQICIAVDLLPRDSALVGRVRDRIIAPSRAIIAEYDEGASNRQVWNDAALLASARALDDSRGVEDAVYGASGIVSHLRGGLLDDGTWFEGENYHLFAHRGLWYGVTMAERAGLALSTQLIDRFQRGFAAPFATALPDFTLPARRDSQYAISLRQWRIAEHCELGLARGDDPVLVGALQRMYCDDVARHSTGRAESSADVERNCAATALTRADLSWRALLFALPELPALEPTALGTTLLEAQGIAVFRRDEGRAYIALDYGHSGGGHGHPDRLNLLLFDGERRWLDDFGTGSYVDPSLHWFRSTLAHNAPLVNGHSQTPADGVLAAYDEQRGAGWIEAIVDGAAPGVMLSRTLVAMPSYVVDLVAWEAAEETTVDLPLHADLRIESGVGAAFVDHPPGGNGKEDGFDFLSHTSREDAEPNARVHARCVDLLGQLDLWASTSLPTQWWRAVAPGPPTHGMRPFRVIRARAPAGVHRCVWSWRGEVASVDFDDVIHVTLRDGSVHDHWRADDGWRVAMSGAQKGIVRLGGQVENEIIAREPRSDVLESVPHVALGGRMEHEVILGEAHYRRSEQSWREAGSPTALVGLRWDSGVLTVRVRVARSDLTFVPAGSVNLYDNEPSEINGDSIELFVRTASGLCGALLVPIAESNGVRERAIDGWSLPHGMAAIWERADSGYEMRLQLPSAPPPLAIDVVINEMPRGRVRRRGQLVLSGATGEFVYLRGDRHEARRLIALDLSDG